MTKNLEQFFEGRRVFVTGYTGFKGCWLCIWLNTLGAEVFGYALEPPTEPSLFRLTNFGAKIRSNTGDIRDFDRLKRCIREAKPEIVFHLASQPLVRRSYNEPLETYETNVMGTVHLLQSIRELDCVRAAVIVTSDKCYQNSDWVWGYRETDRLGGHDPYSSSKACAELVASSFRQSFFENRSEEANRVALATARAGNVVGGGDWAADRLIPDIVRSLVEGKTLTIRYPNATRPWQHVLEPLSGYLLLAKKLYEAGAEYAEAWNFGPSVEQVRSVSWVAERLMSNWNSTDCTLEKSDQPHEDRQLSLDSTKARSRLKWRSRWNIDTTIDRTTNWYKRYLENTDESNVLDACLTDISDYERVD